MNLDDTLQRLDSVIAGLLLQSGLRQRLHLRNSRGETMKQVPLNAELQRHDMHVSLVKSASLLRPGAPLII